MSIQSKKISMAEKFYRENSKGGKGASPKYTQKGKDSKFNQDGKGMSYVQHGKGTKKGGGMSHNQSGGNEKFEGKYNQ